MNKTTKQIIIITVLAAVVISSVILLGACNKEAEAPNQNNELSQDGTENTQQSVDSAEGTKDTTASDGTNSNQKPPAAPDFTVYDQNGNKVKLSDYKGKPVVLNFWATWCYYCKLEMPDFNAAYKQHPEVQFLMVNATDGVRETVDGAKAYVADEGYEFDVFYDTDLDAVKTYGISSYPTTYFINGDGKLIARGNGMLDLASLENGIAMITQEKSAD